MGLQVAGWPTMGLTTAHDQLRTAATVAGADAYRPECDNEIDQCPNSICEGGTGTQRGVVSKGQGNDSSEEPHLAGLREGGSTGRGASRTHVRRPSHECRHACQNASFEAGRPSSRCVEQAPAGPGASIRVQADQLQQL
eukprot:jgi/Ulvmu1/10975/UM007_0154.1